MIPSFHAVFGLRHRDKTAKVIDYKGQDIRTQGITSFTHGYCRFAWLRHNNGSAEISWGLTVTHMEWVFLPFSLIQNRADDFGASFAHLRRKALQPFPQTFATAPAKHCNRSRKRLQLFWSRWPVTGYWPKADGYDFCSIPFRSCAKMAENSSAPCPHKCFSSLKYSGLSRYRPRVW